MKPHRLDPLSLIAGLVIAGIGLAFLLPPDPTDVFTFFGDFGAWFWPVVLVAMGLAIILPAVLRDRTEDDSTEETASQAVRGRSVR